MGSRVSKKGKAPGIRSNKVSPTPEEVNMYLTDKNLANIVLRRTSNGNNDLNTVPPIPSNYYAIDLRFKYAGDPGLKLAKATIRDGAHMILKRLPTRVSEKVVSYLTEPADLVNAAWSSAAFSQVVKSAFFLEAVLPIVFHKLEYAEVLNLRKTSTLVRKIVDEILEAVPLRIDQNHFASSSADTPFKSEEWFLVGNLRSSFGICATLNSSAEIDLFNDSMAHSLLLPNSRPFIGKALVVKCPTNDFGLRFAALQLIDQFQTKIAHLDLSQWNVQTISVVDRYILMKTFFLNLPQLITYRGFVIVHSITLMHFEEDELNECVDLNPLPHLTFLKRIDLCDLTKRLFQEIHSSVGARLKFFTFGNIQDSKRIQLFTFKSLVHLELRLQWRQRAFLKSIIAKSLSSIRINLHFAWNDAPPTDFSKILEPFHNLEILTVDIIHSPDDSRLFQKKSPRSILHGVKKLRINTKSGFIPFTLKFAIAMFPNLEHVVVEDCILGNFVKCSDPDVMMLRRNEIFKSVLWEEAPSLQSVIRNGTVFSKVGYEKMIKQIILAKGEK